MKTGDEKYKRIIKALKNSEPDSFQSSEIQDSVMRSISEKKSRHSESQNIIDFIFGWIWIAWVRKSLITASFCLVAYFVWQQNSMLHEIDRQMQIMQNDRMVTYNPWRILEKKFLLNRITQKENIPEEITVNKADLDRLLDSLYRIQKNYQDTIRMIRNDPDFKKAEKPKKKSIQGLIL